MLNTNAHEHTDPKAELDRLKLESERYRAIVESSDDAIISKDLHSIITSWNRGAQHIFGWTAEEIIGRSVRTLIPPELQEQEDDILARLKKGERIEHFETVRIRKDGGRVDISITVSPIKNSEGTIVGASKVARDIGLRKQTETMMRENERRKDEFLATLSHELRSPLAPLTNALQLLEVAPDDPAIAAQARGMMGRQLRQLVHLVDDLMDLSRVNRGVIELRRTRQDIRTILVQAVEATRPLIDAQGHTLHFDLSPVPLWVDGDPTRLVQIFSNFLNNAAKYTDPGGTITITNEVKDGSVIVCITDTGIGIDPDQLERVFDMFAQLAPASTRKQGGLGIGLSIVKKLVHLHGGSLQARSEGSGRGSTFSVRLPFASTPSPEPPAARALVERASDLRILVTDDNVETAMSLSMLLRRMGHAVRTANNGPDALVEAERFRPQVIFLDIGMPYMDGYQTCQAMRTRPEGAGAFIIALTGWGQTDDRRLAMEAGFDLHLTKPMDRPMLLEALDQARRKLRSERVS